MFINFVIDADNTGDIIKAIELLSYHLNEMTKNEDNREAEELGKWKKENSDLAHPNDG